MSDRFTDDAPVASPPDATPAEVEGPLASEQAPQMLVGTPPEREFTVAQRAQWQLILRRFRQHKLAVASSVVFVIVVLLAFVGGALWHYKYNHYTSDNSVPPSLKHPFGTDEVGYDELALVLRGTQRSIEIAIMVALLASVLGSIYGAVSGFYRGIADAVMMRGVDLILTMPAVLVAALLAHNFANSGGSWFVIALVLAGLSWAYVARVVRGVVLSLREKEYIEASRALGASDWRIIVRHLIPNTMGTIIVNTTILVATAILLETALSYLGFGVQHPDTSLGLLVSDAETAVQTRPWLFFFPGLFIIAIALTINFIGDGLRDAFDPQQTRVRA